MKEENRKESIDLEIIKKEIIRMCNTAIKNNWPFFIVVTLFVILTKLMLDTNSLIIFPIITITIALIILFLVVFDMAYCVRLKTEVRQDKFSISVNKMISQSRPHYSGSTTPPGRYLSGQIRSGIINYYKYKLIFEGKELYYIPMGKNYEWSKLYCMDNVQIYENSKCGDEFYLIKDSNNKIIITYNTRFFEFKQK